MRYREREDTEQEINMSPLIDMVFILLIFFMVSATFVKDMDLEIQRPKASSSTPSSTKAIRVFIDNNGQTYLDEQPVRTWVIQSRDCYAAHGTISYQCRFVDAAGSKFNFYGPAVHQSIEGAG